MAQNTILDSIIIWLIKSDGVFERLVIKNTYEEIEAFDYPTSTS